jgi:hypothetical protein
VPPGEGRAWEAWRCTSEGKPQAGRVIGLVGFTVVSALCPAVFDPHDGYAISTETVS